MSILKITANGQVTLCKDTLEHLGLGPGDKLEVEKLPGGQIIARAQRSGRISDIFGVLKCPDRPSLSIEEVNEGAASGWAGERWESDSRRR